jgi:hypothetical protein
MGALNYFSILCFAWALMGIGSRFIMIYLGQRWNKWELEKVYSEEKPAWIYSAGVAAFILVGYTWFKVFTTDDIRLSWIIALLITLTLIKISILIFHYNKFRIFAKTVLNDKQKLTKLNIGVVIFSVIFILLGVYLY